MKIIFTLVQLFFISCSTMDITTYKINIDSISIKHNTNSKLFILPISQESKLLQEEYKKYLETALIQSGYSISSKNEDSDLTILFSYSIDSEDRIDSVPNYQWVPPQSFNFQSTTFNNSGFTSGTSNTYGTVQETGIGHLQYTGSEVYSYKVFKRFINVSAYNSKDLSKYLKNKKNIPQEIWNLKIISEGKSNDMRKLFPIFIFASKPYLGKNTKGQIRVEILENDKDLKEFISENDEPNLIPKSSIKPNKVPISR